MEDIAELEPSLALKAYSAILRGHQIFSEMEEYKDALSSVEMILTIFDHSYPQNRCDSYPYVGQEESFSMYKMEKDKIRKINSLGDIELKNGRIIPKKYIIRNSSSDLFFIAKEETGLLGLTAREDDKDFPVEKMDVVNFIHELVKNAKNTCELKLSAQSSKPLKKRVLPNIARQTIAISVSRGSQQFFARIPEGIKKFNYVDPVASIPDRGLYLSSNKEFLATNHPWVYSLLQAQPYYSRQD